MRSAPASTSRSSATIRPSTIASIVAAPLKGGRGRARQKAGSTRRVPARALTGPHSKPHSSTQ
eukprot:10801365-Alexandrium_andersonii.AAC.1